MEIVKNKRPVLFEYIWIDGANQLRSKNRVLFINANLCGKNYLDNLRYQDIPEYFSVPKWNFDGSSTKQAEVTNSEVILVPVSGYIDPFLTTETQLAYCVLCETYLPDGTPHESNTRQKANEIFTKFPNEEPWYGIEQEFFVMDLGKRVTEPDTTNRIGTLYSRKGQIKIFKLPGPRPEMPFMSYR